MSLLRQHLIDPEICIRCNTCEETCPIGAVTHNDDNYVVDAQVCDGCLDCISPCPTGSIDNWRMVDSLKAYTVEEQFSWEELPEEIEHELENEGGIPESEESEVSSILEHAHSGQGGKVCAPKTAAQPYINLYRREKPILARVAGNFRITDADLESDVRHIVLTFDKQTFPILEGQSLGIIPPGLGANGRSHHVRLYSVASPRDGERPGANNLSLTVKRVVQGVGSNYMCDLKKGDTVKVTGPFGATFLMPDDPNANLLMICTGTGSAPFRAMTERRRRHYFDAPGKLSLYFGARSPGELPYFGPLNKLSENFIDKQLVFSRLPGKPREYVQDRMLAQSQKLGALLNSDETCVYICGLKEMEQGVDEAFQKICAEQDMDWSSLKTKLSVSGRYHVETY